jgi:ABC-2 type transport system permease protein
MRRVFAQARKELTQLVRDRLALALALVLPVGLTVLLGTAISLTVTDIPIVIQDLDQTPLSRQYSDLFRNSLTFRVVTLPPATSPETMLNLGRVRAAVIIPTHFGRDVRRGRGAEAQMLVDATDGNTARLIRGNATQLTRAFAQQVLPQQAGLRSAGSQPAASPPVGSPPVGSQQAGRQTTSGMIETVTRLWFNPGREPRKFYGPGFMVLALSIFPTVLAALAMSREGEQKTILQVYVSSISAHEFLLGKILAGMVVGLMQCVLGVVLMLTLFGLRFVGDPTPFVVGSVLFVFCMAAFASLVGSAIPNQAAAVQAVGLGAFLLAFLLSGLIFPVENIPDALRWISNLVQARYYVLVVRDAFLQGGGWPAVWWAVLAVGVIGLVFYTLAWRSMRRMQVKA